MEREAESGREKHKERERLLRRVISVEILRGLFVVDGGGSERDVVLNGDDEGGFRERHRFVRWVEVLRRQGWGRVRIFLASPRVWDDRELEGTIEGFISDRRFH